MHSSIVKFLLKDPALEERYSWIKLGMQPLAFHFDSLRSNWPFREERWCFCEWSCRTFSTCAFMEYARSYVQSGDHNCWSPEVEKTCCLRCLIMYCFELFPEAWNASSSTLKYYFSLLASTLQGRCSQENAIAEVCHFAEGIWLRSLGSCLYHRWICIPNGTRGDLWMVRRLQFI